MSIPIQEKIENSTKTAKRKLFDNNIKLRGREIKAIRIFETLDKYEDTTDIDIVSDNTITVYIDDLSLEFPLNRYRLDTVGETPDSESIYLFEVIPIEMYAKWTDNIESGDLLVLIIKDNDINMPVVFRVSDNVGRIQVNLLYRKFNIAPYNPSNIDSSIVTLINAYINSK